MKTKRELIEEIHLSLVNGQRKQAVIQIDEYGLYEFWEDYHIYLADLYPDIVAKYAYFSDAAINYFRIKKR